METINTTVGYRIMGLREMNHIPQQKLAVALGITRQSLSLYERGERSVNAELLLKIADYFNVSTDYLLGRTPNQTADTDLQGVLDFTGLSEKAVENLLYFTKNSEYKYNVLNILLSTDNIKILLCGIVGYFMNTVKTFETYFDKYGDYPDENCVAIGIGYNEEKETMDKIKYQEWLVENLFLKTINELREIAKKYSEGERKDD